MCMGIARNLASVMLLFYWAVKCWNRTVPFITFEICDAFVILDLDIISIGILFFLYDYLMC